MAIRYFGKYTVRTQYTHSAIGRFLEKITVNPDRSFEGSPCWEWQGAKDASGYGRFHSEIGHYAHRFAYHYFTGEVPPGLEIDHKCRNRGCQNPFHLQVVTRQKNRALSRNAKTECIRGHAFDEENTHFTAKGDRVCKACRYDRVKRWRKNHPEEAREVYRRDKAQYREKTG
jgi:hypothetical protein